MILFVLAVLCGLVLDYLLQALVAGGAVLYYLATYPRDGVARMLDRFQMSWYRLN